MRTRAREFMMMYAPCVVAVGNPAVGAGVGAFVGSLVGNPVGCDVGAEVHAPHAGSAQAVPIPHPHFATEHVASVKLHVPCTGSHMALSAGVQTLQSYVGACDGGADGAHDGSSVGLPVGTEVGSRIGDPVGCAVGVTAVGTVVGAAVGGVRNEERASV